MSQIQLFCVCVLFSDWSSFWVITLFLQSVLMTFALWGQRQRGFPSVLPHSGVLYDLQLAWAPDGSS